MAAGGGGRDNARNKYHARESDSSDDDDDDDDSEEEEAGPKLKFVLAGDDTGSGIDYNILEEESWQKLEEYCQKWGLKQAHLESIYSRFDRTILRTEHLDFTYKPQFHASLDFLADEFMTTAGEFAAQFFIQTWFLRRKRGLKPPKDRRCINFARLVIMSCDLARLGDYELLNNLWTCVLHRFGGILPNGTVNLDTQLNTELVREVITVLHTSPDKKLNLLIDTLLAESEELHGSEEGAKTARSSRSGKGAETVEPPEAGEAAEVSGVQGRRYLTLRRILRFSFQHPPLLFPVVQFQRVLRSKIIGSRYWLRRRKPAPERGLSIRTSLGLPDAYHDIFDRIEGRLHAWIVATGHLLLHALDPPPHAVAAASSAKVVDDTSGGSGGGDGGGGRRGSKDDGEQRYRERYHERYGRLLDNCLRPPWHKVDEKVAPTMIGAVGGKMIPSLTVALSRFKASAKGGAPMSKLPSPASPVGGGGGVTGAGNNKPGGDGALVPLPAEQQPDDPLSLADDKEKAHTTPRSQAASRTSPECHSDGSRGRRGHYRVRSGRSPSRGGGGDASPSTSGAAGAVSAPAGSSSSAAGGPKTCAICLRKPSPVALCRRCGRRAAKAFKDERGSRQALVLLVPYGAFFGVGEVSALGREGDAVGRWTRLFDDETGAHFYYNAHYDTSVWESEIELPKPAPPVLKISRHRKGGGGGGVIVKASSPTSARPTSPPASPAVGASANESNQGGPTRPTRLVATSPTRLAATAAGEGRSSRAVGRLGSQKSKTAFSTSSMAVLHEATRGSVRGGLHGSGGGGGGPGGGGGAIKPALKAMTSSTSLSPPRKVAAALPSAPASPAGRNKVVVLAAAEEAAVPEIVIDAHKRMYPPFRLLSREDAQAAAAAAATAAAGVAVGGMEGVVPGGRLTLASPRLTLAPRKSSSRGGSGTPGDSAAGRSTAVGTLARAGTVQSTGTLQRTGTAKRAGTMKRA